MLIKKLKNGFAMPMFGLGTWMMGGAMEADPSNDDKTDIIAIKNAIDAGIIHIDTAEIYANGHSEELVGKAIENYDRKKLFLVSKVARGRQKKNQVLESCEESMKRMGVDYLDLYLLHAPSYDVPIEQTMKAMDKLKADGKIKNIGVSNFTVKQFERAQKATKNKIVANQLHYNLKVREIEDKEILKYCQKNDVMVIAWRPLEMGRIIGSDNLLNEVSEKYGKTEAQIAINWLISQKNVVTLSKMRSKKHLVENLGALGWKMDKQDVEKLRKGFKDQVEVSPVLELKEWE
jgi:diketogulonate reductase-like aldo/keto reductase